MKKSILKLLPCAAVAVLAAACSTDDGLSAEQKEQIVAQEMIDYGMKPSTEGISLQAAASNVSETRGVINSTTDNFFETEKDAYGDNTYTIGMMMLAQTQINTELSDLAKQTSYPEYAPYNYLKVDWSSPKSELGSAFDDVWSVYLKNVPTAALYIKNGANITGTELKMRVDDKYKFYPIGNYHNYNFYAYHPIVDDNKVTYTKDSVIVEYDDLNGDMDVIWGFNELKNSDSPTDLRYSAKYFRYSQNRDANDVPKPVKMNFEHMMMQLRFNITAGGTPLDRPDYDRNYEEAYQTEVLDISITNVPSSMRLIVADRYNQTMAATKRFIPNGKREKAYKIELTENGSGVKPQPSNTYFTSNPSKLMPKKTQLTKTMLVPILEDLSKNPYMIQMTLRYKGVTMPLLVPMRLPVETALGDFQNGRIYDIDLTIYSPIEINANATLKKWEEAGYNPFVKVEVH